MLIFRHIDGPLKSLLIKDDGRVRLMKDALKQIQDVRVKGLTWVKPVMSPQTMLSCIRSVVDVKLGISNIYTVTTKNRASLMDEFATQDIGVRATATLIDSMIDILASRSHGQRIVVKENMFMKGITDMVIGSEKVIERVGDVIKMRKGYFALKAAHAKLGIIDCGMSKGFSFPMKGMAKRTLNVHSPKSMNLPCRIKGTACKGNVQNWWHVKNMIN